jgi:hypothetical protein
MCDGEGTSEEGVLSDMVLRRVSVQNTVYVLYILYAVALCRCSRRCQRVLIGTTHATGTEGSM